MMLLYRVVFFKALNLAIKVLEQARYLLGFNSTKSNYSGNFIGFVRLQYFFSELDHTFYSLYVHLLRTSATYKISINILMSNSLS